MVESRQKLAKEEDFKDDDDSHDEEYRTVDNFKNYEKELKPKDFDGQLHICSLKLLFDNNINNLEVLQAKVGAGFLFDTVTVNKQLFGVILTCGHIFLKPNMKYAKGTATFKFGKKQKEIICVIKQVYISDELKRIASLKRSTLTSNDRNQHKLNDYAFVVIELTASFGFLTQSDSSLHKTFNIKKWGFGQQYFPVQMFEKEVHHIQNRERNISMVCPFRYVEKDAIQNRSTMYTGYTINPAPFYSLPIETVEKILTVYSIPFPLMKKQNIPNLKGQSGSVLGYATQNNKKFYPIGIHLGYNKKCNFNYGRLLTNEIVEIGQQICEQIAADPAEAAIRRGDVSVFKARDVHISSQTTGYYSELSAKFSPQMNQND